MILDINNIEKDIQKFKQKSIDLERIINPVLEKYKLERKDVLEICQIGKFLLNINPDITIIEKPRPPNPDFILQLNKKKIGLEHTRIINKINSQKVFSINTLLDEAASEFKKRHPENKICVTFRIVNDELNYKQSDKKGLIDSICNFIFEATAGNYSNQPIFISKIKIMPNSAMSFSYLENNFIGEYLTNEELIKSLRKKEDNLKKYYSQNVTIDEFWLVLMLGSLSAASFRLNNNIHYQAESIFDKVFLMEDFEENIIRIK